MNSRIIEHYDKKYQNASYENVNRIVVDGYPSHRAQAAVFWGGTGEHLLEIGVGCGDVLLSLSDKYKQCVGVELSPKRAQEAERLFDDKENVRIITGNFEDIDLDYPPEFFDTVIMVAVIEHMIDPFGAIEKIYKLLKPGGRVIIDTPNIAKWTRRIKLLFGFFPATASFDEGFVHYDKKTPTDLYDEGHFHYFTFRSLSKMLKRFKFNKVEHYGYGNSFLSRIYPKLFSECFVVGIK